MFPAKFEYFRNIRFIFETIIDIYLITLMAKIMDPDPLPTGNPWHFPGMYRQKKHPFMEHFIM